MVQEETRLGDKSPLIENCKKRNERKEKKIQ